MIVDTSAIIAIVQKEPDYKRLVQVLADSAASGIGTPTLVEAGIVLSARLGIDATGLLGRLVQEFGIAEVPFGDAHWREAVRAYARFGRGRHPAGLNFGDCLSYATARLADQPLLYVGSDFSRTDLKSVLND